MHYTASYLLNPTHPITVSLVGLGGTGSQVLTGLARMHIALTQLQHPGLRVTAYDGDQVSAANIGRQAFSPSDVGYNKATLLVSRINRFFGLSWRAVDKMYNEELWNQKQAQPANLLITCVDWGKTRLAIHHFHRQMELTGNNPLHHPYYWLDFGNSRATGQVVLGTLQPIRQPPVKSRVVDTLPTVIDLFPDIEQADQQADQGPSCSLLEALTRQDLFINSTLAQFGVNLLWKLFREVRINYQGAYINLETYTVNPIRF